MGVSLLDNLIYMEIEILLGSELDDDWVPLSEETPILIWLFHVTSVLETSACISQKKIDHKPSIHGPCSIAM